MAITFEEVTADVQSAPQGGAPADSATKSAGPADDLRERIAAELRLLAERAARLSAD